MREAQKRRAASAAIERVEEGDVVGLGSGSTAGFAIRALGESDREIVGVPSSYQAADVAREVGVPVRTPADVDGIDIAIDGADQVAGRVLVKGGGGAHTREKVIDAAAAEFVVIVDESKLIEPIDMPIPLEVLPEARSPIASRVRELGGYPTVRRTNDRPFITDNGNQIIDADFGAIERPEARAKELGAIPGVLEHGLFIDLADVVIVGTPDGVAER